MAATKYVQLREELGAKSRQLHEITSTAGGDLDMEKVLKAGLVPGAKTAEDIVAHIKKSNDELVALETEFAPYRAVEAAATNASEYEKLFNQPASTIHMPGASGGPAAGRGPNGTKTLGQLFTADPAFLAFREGRARHAQIELPTDGLQAAVFLTSSGYAPQAVRSGMNQFLPLRPIAVIDWIPEIPIDQAADVYMEETTATEAAAERAEGGAYAEATYIYTERTKTVRSVGESLPVTDEQMADIAGMQGLLEGRLTLSVRRRLDLNVLAGSGIAPNLEGTESVTGIQTQALGADNIGDAIYKLHRAIRDDGFAEPEVTFIRALKWQTWRLAKTVDGIYLNGAPSDAGPDRIWGVPVVQTNATTLTKAIAGAYSAYSALRTKTGLLVELGYVNDDFTKGKKTLRAGVRVAMSHYRPKAFGQVTGL